MLVCIRASRSRDERHRKVKKQMSKNRKLKAACTLARRQTVSLSFQRSPARCTRQWCLDLFSFASQFDSRDKRRQYGDYCLP